MRVLAILHCHKKKKKKENMINRMKLLTRWDKIYLWIRKNLLFIFRQQWYAELPETSSNSNRCLSGWIPRRNKYSLASTLWDYFLFEEDTFTTLINRFVNFSCTEPFIPALFVETYSHAFNPANTKTTQSCNNWFIKIYFIHCFHFFNYISMMHIIFGLPQIRLYVWL